MQPLTPLYVLIGALLAYAAWRIAREPSHQRRWSTAAFWGLLALLFFAGDWMPTTVVGALVIVIGAIAGFGGVQRGTMPDDPTFRAQSSARLGHRLFLPALLIPLVTVVAWLVLKQLTRDGKPIFEAQHATLYALVIACVIALAVALRVTRDRPDVAMDASRNLLEAMSWAAVLPLALAMLGSVFAKAGVGEVIAHYVAQWIPTESRFACVLAYALGMAAFTMVMGNAFAAFPVMTVGVALPLLVGVHGADPAPLAAIGMLSGYCGTLMTPMAANYNIVPAALLELSDQYAVIKQQVVTGLLLLATNVALMNTLAFR
jgi:uncharacterized membrane protein